jgi:pantoate--beta-alanine ligase
MVRDLNFPVKIVVAQTHREPDGLAMSSRNKYLSTTERQQAIVLSKALALAKKSVNGHLMSSAELKGKLERFIATFPDARLDYVELFDPRTLRAVSKAGQGTQMALAVFLGKTRLIDNETL